MLHRNINDEEQLIVNPLFFILQELSHGTHR